MSAASSSFNRAIKAGTKIKAARHRLNQAFNINPAQTSSSTIEKYVGCLTHRNGPERTNWWLSRISTCRLQNLPRAAMARRRMENENRAHNQPAMNVGQNKDECRKRNSTTEPPSINAPASTKRRKVRVSLIGPEMVVRFVLSSTTRAR